MCVCACVCAAPNLHIHTNETVAKHLTRFGIIRALLLNIIPTARESIVCQFLRTASYLEIYIELCRRALVEIVTIAYR